MLQSNEVSFSIISSLRFLIYNPRKILAVLQNILNGMAQVKTMPFGTKTACPRVTLALFIVSIILKTTKDAFAKHLRTSWNKLRIFVHMNLSPFLNLIPIQMSKMSPLSILIQKSFPILNQLMTLI